MKTVLITGANSGIGLCIAKRLLNQGYTVFGTSRSPDKHQDKMEFELLPLDITSQISIEHCMELFLSKSAVLDILINNAGIGICGSAEETSPELAHKQFQTNFWGAVNMTKAVLPLMRQQRSGKIITIGSLAGLIGVPFQSYYSASKHALEGFFKTLRLEVRSFNIKVSVIEPGFYKSDLHNAFEYAEPWISDYNDIRNDTLSVFSKSIKKAPLPEPVASTVLKIIKSENPRFSYPVGFLAKIAPGVQCLSHGMVEFVTLKKFRL